MNTKNKKMNSYRMIGFLYWITFVTKEALARGIKPFWWDTGVLWTGEIIQ
jgi:hypothetical protein